MIKRKILFISIVVIIFSTGFFSLSSVSNGINNDIPTSTLKTSFLDYTNATVISDDGTNWNVGSSNNPAIVVGIDGKAHVVWQDSTDGLWGTDSEIMYASSIDGITWTNATAISDDISLWNDDSSFNPDIAIDKNNQIHVVWYDYTDGAWGIDTEIMYTSSVDGITWTNATIVSDDGTNWNNGSSIFAEIAVDITNQIHVVWEDETDGVWGIDVEIMYASNDGSGWTNATVISDDGTNWNDGYSNHPDIAVDKTGKINVVWSDNTDGAWGGDDEIMYSFNNGAGWSNVTIISDDGILWNDGASYDPQLAIDNEGTIHVVWDDYTDGAWGIDTEIMYTSSVDGITWTNATIVSDDGTNWNNGLSIFAEIAVDTNEIVHVVWQDYTDGVWGIDTEIMYSLYNGTEWSNATVVSDGYNETYWNDDSSFDSSIAVSKDGKAYIVWFDSTDGAWGTDTEIMYTSFSAFTPSSGGGISFGYTFIFFMIIGVISIIGYTKKKL